MGVGAAIDPVNVSIHSLTTLLRYHRTSCDGRPTSINLKQPSSKYNISTGLELYTVYRQGVLLMDLVGIFYQFNCRIDEQVRCILYLALQASRLRACISVHVLLIEYPDFTCLSVLLLLTYE